ncbi:MAG: tetratricopeptide repeat protein [Bacteroidota bacterium]
MRLRIIILILFGFCFIGQAQNSKENADFKLAVSLFNDKLYDLALEQFHQFVTAYPNTQQGIEAKFYLGLTQTKMNRYEEARFSFQNFALAFPDHPKAAEAWWNSAEAYVQLGNHGEAALAFERVKGFHPRNRLAPSALLKASEYFGLSGNRDNARKALRTLTQEYASSDVIQEARIKLAQMYFDDGQHEMAAAEAKRAADAAPNTPQGSLAAQLTAQSLAAMGKTEEAKRILGDLISRLRGGETVYEPTLELGRLHKESGNPEEAIKTWSILLDPQKRVPAPLRQSAHLETGDALVLQGKFGESIQQFELGAKTGGARTSEALYKVALSAERVGNDSKAGEYFLKAVDADSSASKAISLGGFRGAVYLGHHQQAVRLSQRFRERFPSEEVLPRLLLATASILARDLNDTRQAINLYEKIMTDFPGSPVEDDAMLGFARALRMSGSSREALVMLESFRKRFPASDLREAADEESFAISTFELKDKDGGLENIALLTGDVIAGKPKADLAFRLAEIYFNDLKDYESASDQYLAAIRSGLTGEKRTRAWFRHGRALEFAARNTSTPEKVSLAVASYDSVLKIAEPMLAADAFAAKIRLLIRTASSVSDLRRLSDSIRRNSPQGIPSHELLLTLGEAYQRVRSHSDARTVFEEILRTRPNMEIGGHAMFRLAMTRFEMGEKDSAGMLLATYVERHPSHRHTATAIQRLAAFEAEKGRVERVLELCRLLEQQFRYTDAAKNVNELRADVYYAAGSVANARQYYERVYVQLAGDLLDPTDIPPGLILKLADCARRTSDYAGAKKLYAQALARDTSSSAQAQIFFALAGIAREENNIEAAARYLQEASKLGSSNPERQFQASLESANLLFEGEDFPGAVSRYGDLLARAPGDTVRRFLEARIVACYFRLDNSAEAEKRAGAFVKVFPNAKAEAAQFEYERGRLHLRKEELDLAIRRLENARQRYPQAPVIPETVYWLARALELKNDPQRAVQLYDSLLTAFPGHPLVPRVLLSLGNVYYAMEQWDAAAKHYKTIVDGNQGSADVIQYALSNLVMAYKEIGLFDAALQLTRRYIERYPNDPDLILKHIDIGVLYQKLGYYDQSILHLQNMLGSADQELEGELRYYLGEAYFYKGEYQQAILEFLKVPYLITQRTRVDWVATSYYMAGQSYEKMSKFEQAITMYRQIIDRAGIDPTFKSAAQKEIDRVTVLVQTNSR